jgi:hypothetical protein
MQTIVILFVIAVILGAVALQIKMQTVVWRAVAEAAKDMPRWAVWLWVGVCITAVIVGVTLEFVWTH